MRRILIQNGWVTDPGCRKLIRADVLIEGEHIAAIGRDAALPSGGDYDITDASGKYVLPGLIDIHTHGSVGINYSVSCDFHKVLAFQAGQGVTTVIPSVGVRLMDELVSARSIPRRRWDLIRK